MSKRHVKRPKTFEEAVEMVLEDLEPGERRELKSMAEGDLWQCHFGLALYIRNNYGLWEEGWPLMGPDSLPTHPDDASNRIVEEVWRRLQTTE